MAGARSHSIILFTEKQWLLTNEMTVSTSWWCRFASPANSTVVLQFYLPDYFLMHVFKMHVPRPYFQKHWCTRYSGGPMMSMFKAPHVILTKVAPDRETTESPLGPRFQCWQLPPRDFEDVLVSEQTAARLLHRYGVLVQQCTICSKKYMRTMTE